MRDENRIVLQFCYVVLHIKTSSVYSLVLLFKFHIIKIGRTQSRKRNGLIYSFVIIQKCYTDLIRYNAIIFVFILVYPLQNLLVILEIISKLIHPLNHNKTINSTDFKFIITC